LNASHHKNIINALIMQDFCVLGNLINF